jgi:hypothetical protein
MASFHSSQACCIGGKLDLLKTQKYLGMDEHFAEVSIWVCPDCGQYWLRYFYEVEAFPSSGRWYLGAVTPELAASLVPAHARAALEALDWYYYGGSYFHGKSGKASGRITLNP